MAKNPNNYNNQIFSGNVLNLIFLLEFICHLFFVIWNLCPKKATTKKIKY